MDLKPLYRWYDKNKRSLAFRERRDAYAVWVAEVMLQQTRVAAMEERYRNFLRLFPDQQSLARATERDVLSAWSGLGYYRRCRNLHQAAQKLTADNVDFPADFKAALALPGVGRYTAGAVLSQAYGVAVPAVDGNVRRLLGRIFESTEVDAIAERLIQSRGSCSPGDHNQALMELGALICLPRRPRCDVCPLRSACKARLSGRTEWTPVKSEKIALELEVLFLHRRGKYLIHRSAQVKFFKNMWSLPLRFRPPLSSWTAALISEVVPSTATMRMSLPFSHSITEHRLKVYSLEGALPGRFRLSNNWQTVSIEELKVICAPSLFQKAIKRMLEIPERTDA